MNKKDKNARIEEYRNRLPHLKERLTGALLLLLVGVLMFTTVSFAWISLSTNPEVSNISTSVASNGMTLRVRALLKSETVIFL